MNIEILKNVVISTETGKNNKTYSSVEVNYKNLFDGKVASRKIIQFEGAYKLLSAAKEGQRYIVTPEKNDRDFWNWTSATYEGTEPVEKPSKPQPTPRSTYETHEERARRQVYIIRQSSLSTAVAYLTLTGKTKSTPEEVIKVADQFANYVLDSSLKAIIDMDDEVLWKAIGDKDEEVL